MPRERFIGTEKVTELFLIRPAALSTHSSVTWSLRCVQSTARLLHSQPALSGSASLKVSGVTDDTALPGVHHQTLSITAAVPSPVPCVFSVCWRTCIFLYVACTSTACVTPSACVAHGDWVQGVLATVQAQLSWCCQFGMASHQVGSDCFCAQGPE